MKKLLRAYFDSLGWVSVKVETGEMSESILGYLLGVLFFPVSFPIYSFFYWLYK